MGDADNVQAIDSGEIARVACEDRKPICNGRRSNHGIVCAGRRFAATSAERGGNLAESPRGRGIKRDRIKVVFGLLQVRLARCSLGVGARDKRAHGELRKCDGGDEWFGRQQLRIPQTRQQDDGRGVENATGQLDGSHQIRLSRSSSMSFRHVLGSRTGKCLQRASKTSAVSVACRNGRSSATGLPSRVIVMRSPRETRSMTWPPRFRKSRMLTSVIVGIVSPVRQGWNQVASAHPAPGQAHSITPTGSGCRRHAMDLESISRTPAAVPQRASARGWQSMGPMSRFHTGEVSAVAETRQRPRFFDAGFDAETQVNAGNQGAL